MKEYILIFIAAFCFSTMTYTLREINKFTHDVVYGKVEVRGKVFSCKEWRYTK